MEKQPLISIIVPVYKVEAYLPRCVDSLINQTYGNLEFILVDDGSPDNCGALCDAFARKDPRIRVIHKENGGLSSARNAGIDIARGEYLGFVDSDDWVEPEMFESLISMALSEDVKLVCCGRYDFKACTGEKKVGLCPEKREVISGEELVRRIFTWQQIDSAAWDKLYHRSLFREIRYPHGKINEDIPTTYRIALDAGRAGMVNQPFYNYFHRSGSITTACVSEKNFHMAEHTRAIYADIQERHPQLLQEARYLRTWTLSHLLLRLEQAGSETRIRFREEYRSMKKELRSHLFFILTSPIPKWKQRLTWLLLATGGYMLLRKAYHLFH